MVTLGDIHKGYLVCWRIINILRLATIWIVLIIFNSFWPSPAGEVVILVTVTSMGLYYAISDSTRDLRAKGILLNEELKEVERVHLLFQEFPVIFRVVVKRLFRFKQQSGN